MDEELSEKLARYLQKLQPDLTDLRVENLRRFFGGSSKPTYRADMVWQVDGGSRKSGIVVRTTPERSLVDHRHDIEADALTVAARHGLKVPGLIARETDTSHIGCSFFIMNEIAGCESQAHILANPHYLALREQLGQQKWRLLGQLAAIELSEDERALFPPAEPGTSWETELDKWEHYYHENAQEYEPVVEYALRWLRASPPSPPDKLALVHGDFRTGNFLFDRQGNITALLDWEMAHLGDPMEDVGWAVGKLWSWPEHDRPGHLLLQPDALAIWEQASGLRVDPASLRWWTVFGNVKGMGLWAAMARKVNEQGSMIGMDYSAAWFPYDGHLRELSGHLFAQVA
jgi:aminoglycoside phosphotransferase (APT) family kinase protein